MKILKFVLLSLFLCSGLIINACSDESQPSASNPLVGIWTAPCNDKTTVLSFSGDNRFTWQFGYSNRRDGSGTFSYNAQSAMLTFHWDNGSSKVYFVTELTGTRLVIVDEYFNSEAYTKL